MAFQFVSRFIFQVVFQFVSLFFLSRPVTSSPEGPPIESVGCASIASGSSDNPASTTSAQSSSHPNATPSDNPSSDPNLREPEKLGKGRRPGDVSPGEVLYSVEHAIERRLHMMCKAVPNQTPDPEDIFKYVASLEVVRITKRPLDEFYVQRCTKRFWPPSAAESNNATSFNEESHVARGIPPQSFQIGVLDSRSEERMIHARRREGTTNYIPRWVVKSLKLQCRSDSESNVTVKLFWRHRPEVKIRCTLHIRDDISEIFLGNKFPALPPSGHDRDSVGPARSEASRFQVSSRSSTASHASFAQSRNDEVLLDLNIVDVLKDIANHRARSKRFSSAETSDS